MIAIVWLIVELRFIFNHFVSPTWFILLYTILGIISALLSVFLFYKIGVIKELHKNSFFIFIITFCVMIISCMSLINRTYYTETYLKKGVLFKEPLCYTEACTVKIIFDKKTFTLRIPVNHGAQLHTNDSVAVSQSRGLLGFQFLTAPPLDK